MMFVAALLFAVLQSDSPAKEAGNMPSAASQRFEVSIKGPDNAPSGSSWQALVKDGSWPAVVFIGLVLFRRPLASFLEAVGRRAQKLTAAGFAIELAASAQPTPLLDSLDEIRDPAQGGQLQDSSRGILMQVASRDRADYMVVDLGSGDEWLTSRLYIAAAVIPRMRGVQAIVFVGRVGATEKAFVGYASPDAVRWGLAQRYQWLEPAFASAYGAMVGSANLQGGQFAPLITSRHGALDAAIASSVVSQFIAALQVYGVPPANDSTWVELSGGRWERAEWITADRIKAVLGTDLHLDTASSDDPGARSLARQILKRSDASYAAELGRDGTFLALHARQPLIERVVARVVADLTPAGDH